MSDATVHIDGGSRGNPGPAAYAFVLRRPGFPVYEECDTLGTATNNVAEYTALLRALELATELAVTTLAVFSDSELLVRQMRGEYKVKSLDLQALHRAATGAARGVGAVTFTHVRREFNKDADKLCNEALDGRPRRRITPSEAPLDVAPDVPADPLTAAALSCLAAAAHSWAARGPADPPVAAVWAQLQQIVAAHKPAKAKRRPAR